MKKILVLILLLSIIFSGCSTGGSMNGFFGGSSSNTPSEDRTGSGLSMSVSTDDKWVSIKRVDFTLDFKNTGSKLVEVDRSDFKLTTKQRKNDDASAIAFTDESVDNLYDKIFNNGVLQVGHDQDVSEILGTLIIEDWFYDNLANEKLEYEFKLKYDYSTEFRNNLEIDLSEGSSRWLRVTDSISQAAPVKISEIELIPSTDVSDGIYTLLYTIEDRGGAKAEDRNIVIEDLEILFRGQDLGGCVYYKTDSNDNLIELENQLVLTKDNSELLVACDVNLNDFEESGLTTTTTSGSFSYEYTLKEEGVINLPKERNSNPLSNR